MLALLHQLGAAQDSPIDVGAQILTTYGAGCRPLDIRTTLSRDLALSMGPLRYENGRDADGNRELHALTTLLIHEFEKFHALILSDSLNQLKHFAPSVVKRFAL